MYVCGMETKLVCRLSEKLTNQLCPAQQKLIHQLLMLIEQKSHSLYKGVMQHDILYGTITAGVGHINLSSWNTYHCRAIVGTRRAVL